MKKSILLPLLLIVAVFATGLSSANAEIQVATPVAPHTTPVLAASTLLTAVLVVAVVAVVVVATVVSETTSTTATTGAVPVAAASAGVTKIPPEARQAYAAEFDN